MDDNVSVVNQQPPRIYGTFMVVRRYPFFLQSMLDFFKNGAYLPVGFPGADNKVIGKGAYFSGIQQHDIAGLLITGGSDRFTCYF